MNEAYDNTPKDYAIVIESTGTVIRVFRNCTYEKVSKIFIALDEKYENTLRIISSGEFKTQSAFEEFIK